MFLSISLLIISFITVVLFIYSEMLSLSEKRQINRLRCNQYKILTPEKIKELQPGDWFEMSILDFRKIFYVWKNDGDVWYSAVGWPANYGVHINEDDLRLCTFKYLGRTKKRWWWMFLPWRVLVCPYPLPKEK